MAEIDAAMQYVRCNCYLARGSKGSDAPKSVAFMAIAAIISLKSLRHSRSVFCMDPPARVHVAHSDFHQLLAAAIMQDPQIV